MSIWLKCIQEPVLARVLTWSWDWCLLFIQIGFSLFIALAVCAALTNTSGLDSNVFEYGHLFQMLFIHSNFVLDGVSPIGMNFIFSWPISMPYFENVWSRCFIRFTSSFSLPTMPNSIDHLLTHVVSLHDGPQCTITHTIKSLFKVYKDMIYFLLGLAVFFTQNTKVVHLICDVSSTFETNLFLSNYFLVLRFWPA